MADRVLGKSLDCLDLAEHSTERLVDLVGDFGGLAVPHLVEAAAAVDFVDPLEVQRCCSSAEGRAASGLLVVTHAAATKQEYFSGESSMKVSGTHRQQLRHVL